MANQLTVAITSDVSGLQEGIQQTQKAVGGMSDALGAIGRIGAIAYTAAAAGAVAFAKNSVDAAMRVDELNQVLQALSKNTGISYDAMQQQVTGIRQVGIEAATAQEAVAQFARANLDMAKATDLARVAQDLGVITGQNTTDTMNQLLYAIQTQNSQLDVFQKLNIKSGDAMDAYAKSIGTTADQLTQAQRQQAVLNAVLQAGTTIAGSYAAAMETPGKVLGSYPRLLNDIQVNIGTGLLPAMKDLVLWGFQILEAFGKLTQQGQPLGDLFAAIGQAIDQNIKPTLDVITGLVDRLKDIPTGTVDQMAKAFGAIGPALVGATAGIAVFAGQSIPFVSQFADLLGPAGPVIVGITAFALSIPQVRSALADLMVALAPLITALGTLFTQALSDLMTAITPVITAIAQLAVSLVSSLVPVVIALLPAFQTLVGAFMDLLGAVLPLVPPLAQFVAVFVSSGLAPVLSVVASALVAVVNALQPILPLILGAVVAIKAFSLAMAALNAIMALNPFVLIAIAIALLIVGLVALYNNWQPFHDLVNATAAAVAAFVQGAIQWLVNAFQFLVGIFQLVTGALGQFAPLLLVLLGPIGLVAAGVIYLVQNFGTIVNAVQTVLGALGAFMSGLGSVAAAVAGFVGAVVGQFGALAGAVGGIVWGLLGTVAGAFGGIASAMVGAVAGAVSAVAGAMSGLAGAVHSAGSAAVNAAVGLGKDIVNGVVSGIQSMAGAIGDTLSGIAKGALDAAKKAVSGSPPMWSLGRDMMLGWAQGLRDNRGLVQQAMALTAGPLLQPVGVPATGPGAVGQSPALVINQATFQSEADITVLMRQMEFAIEAGRL